MSYTRAGSIAVVSTRSCGKRYSIRQDIATKSAMWADYAGKAVIVGMIDSWLQRAHITLGDGNMDVVPLDYLDVSGDHDFPNTGAQRSWCNHCSTAAFFNWRSGKYEAE